mgnify:CR=1 FL=1
MLSEEKRQAILDKAGKWLEIERAITQYYGAKMGSTGDERLKALYQRLYIDSLKHLHALEAITRVLKVSESEAKFSDLRIPLRDVEHLRRQLSKEKASMEYAKALAEIVEDEVFQLLLKQMLADEIQHHELLTAIMNTLLPAPPEGEEVGEREEQVE